MKHTPQKTSGRTKRRFNAYLDTDLADWGEEHASKAFKTARKPKGETLSWLTERLIEKYKKSVERKAAKRAALRTNRPV